MNAAIFRKTAFACVCLLTGCATTLPLAMPSVVEVRVIGSDQSRLLRATDPDYGRLKAWVAANRTGWSRYYATNPNGGIRVSLGTFDLQFVGGAVFTLATDQMLFKNVKESDYSFLVK